VVVTIKEIKKPKIKEIKSKVKEVVITPTHTSTLEEEVSDTSDASVTDFHLTGSGAPILSSSDAPQGEQELPRARGESRQQIESMPTRTQVYGTAQKEMEKKYNLNTIQAQKEQTSSFTGSSRPIQDSRHVFDSPQLAGPDSADKETNYELNIKSSDTRVKRRYPWET